MKNNLSCTLMLISILTVFASCSSVETKRFQSFQETVNVLNTSSQETLSEVVKVTREAGIQKLSKGKEIKPSDLMISIQGYEWSLSRTPVYLKVKKAKFQLESFNSLLAKYSELISQVAGAEINKKKTFSELAKDLNENSKALYKTLGSKSDFKSAGILSSGTIAILEAFINNKRAKVLEKAILMNQSHIESHVQLMVELIDLMKELITKVYSDHYTKLSMEWIKASNKEEISRSIFSLNDLFLQQIEHLATMRSGFIELSSLHRSLASKDKGGFSFRVKEIERSIKRFQEIQKAQKDS